ncbi:N-acetyltransferase family protein [Telmatobacter bradus]|uniref:GNAT family N-acetyltransferase n=1 Tax=Telmatobacter bradus TaxID=474953 RepID=UPI003B431D22
MMLIRRATEADLEVVLQLIRRVVPQMQASGNPQWNEQYPNRQFFEHDVRLQQLWVAEDSGAIAGVVALTLDQTPEYANVGWDLQQEAIVAHRLAVDPEVRGKGVAMALMQQAEVIAAERGTRLLRADTNSTNKAMQELFVKLGYLYAGETEFAGRPGLSFYCYEKQLAE